MAAKINHQKTRRKKSVEQTYYIDNKKFYDALVEFKRETEKATAEGRERPQIPNYIGECFYKIAARYSNRYNFKNYPFREDMIMDGVYDCCKYIDSFDPERSKNPFGYFTQAMHFAFIRRIDAEKKYLYTKFKAIENTEIFNLASDKHDYDTTLDYGEDLNYSPDARETMSKFIEDYEYSMRRKKEKQKGRDNDTES